VVPRHVGALASFTRVDLKLAGARAKLVGLVPRHVGSQAKLVDVVLRTFVHVHDHVYDHVHVGCP
jgi:hypothetical protein